MPYSSYIKLWCKIYPSKRLCWPGYMVCRECRKDPRMSYSVDNQTEVDQKRMEKTARKIQGCMIKHLFDYRPG